MSKEHKPVKHSFVYSVIEDFVKIDSETKKQLKKIKLKKDKNLPDMNFTSYWDDQQEKVLKDLLNRVLKDIFLKYKITLKECWVQKYFKNNYHGLHTHYPEYQSFIWFIEGDQNSSPIKFYDVGWPLVNTNKSIVINFNPGTLLIFPGFLPHEVAVNTNNNRLVVSGNVI
jgi:hypothetical protein